MSRGGAWLMAAFALALSVSCNDEVTLHLLKTEPQGASAAGAGQANGGATNVPEPGIAGEAGANAASPGNAGSSSSGAVEPCQALGPEVCNGGDDDCNGTVDDDCAYTIAWSDEPNPVPLGHATGGVDFSEPCPRGAVLSGLRLGFGNWLNQAAAVCRQVVLDIDTSSTPASFSVSLGPRHDTSLAPAASTDSKNHVQDFICPDGSTLLGVDGATTDDEAKYIFGMRLSCAPLAIVPQGASFVLDVDRAKQSSVGPLVCAGCMASQAYNYASSVPVARVATRIFGGDGLWVDRIGFGASEARIVAR